MTNAQARSGIYSARHVRRSVSYTHLDVYKRQPLDQLLSPQLRAWSTLIFCRGLLPWPLNIPLHHKAAILSVYPRESGLLLPPFEVFTVNLARGPYRVPPSGARWTQFFFTRCYSSPSSFLITCETRHWAWDWYSGGQPKCCLLLYHFY